MSTTKNGIYYPNDYESVADIPADMKKLAESTDNAIEKAKYNDTELKNKNTEQDTNIQKNTEDIEQVQVEITALQKECSRLNSDIKAIAIPGQVVGENITLNDSSDARFRKFEIGGNTKQETREGYNLLPSSSKYTHTVSNVTISSDGTGKYVMNGNGSGYTETIKYTFTLEKEYAIKNNDYLHLMNKGTVTSNAIIILLDSNMEGIVSYDFNSNNRIENLSNYAGKSIKYIQLYMNPIQIDLTLTPMIINGVSTAKPFEPYGAMPSPEFESPVKTVGQNVNLLELIEPKEIERITNYTIDATGYTIHTSSTTSSSNLGRIMIDTTSIINNTKSYTLSCDLISDIDGNALIGWYGANKTKTITLKSNIKTNVTITLEKLNATLLTLGSFVSNSTLKIENLKLEPGTVATTYSPYGQGSTEILVDNGLETTDINYKSQTYTIPIQKEFAKIGDVKDTFAKQDGKWYEKHCIQKVIINGSETNIGWHENAKNFHVIKGPKGIRGKGFCNFYKAGDSARINEFDISYDGTSLYFHTPNDEVNNLEKVREWLSNNNLTVYYILATPQLIECTAEQSAILDEIEKELHTYKGQTHIYSTDELSPIFDIEYNVDTQSYIDNQINNMQAMILAG